MNKKLSVAIATFNEERNIERCLKSVEFADEIVVVDGGSTDKTVAIAKKYNAVIIPTSNPPIFHINKQKALDSATGDWILQLDADEEVRESLREEIRSVIQNDKSHTAYYIPRDNFLLGKLMRKGGTYPDYVIRLIQKGKGHFPCKTVHEQIAVDGSIGYLTNSLMHKSYPSFDDYIRKANTYTTLTAMLMADQQISINAISYIAYMVWYPLKTFVTLYVRHGGFRDKFPGLVWAFFSALHHPIAFIKYWEHKHSR